MSQRKVFLSHSVVVVHSLSHVQPFTTQWTAACQASLSSTISQSFFKFMSISKWCYITISSSASPFFCLQSFTLSGFFFFFFFFFPMSWLFSSDGQRIGALASALVLPVNIQGWFSIGITGLISLQSKGLKSLLQYHNSKPSILGRSTIFMVQLSYLQMTTTKIIAFSIWTFVGKVMSLIFNMLSSFIIAFLPRSKHLFNFTATVILQWFWSPSI